MAEIPDKSLDETVRRIRNNIRKISQKQKPINEEMTKVALINPMLIALGWNLEDPDEVAMEYRKKPKDSPVDYALSIQRSPCLFVEAKPLKADTGDYKWIRQTIGYATFSGVEWCVLTNGDEYRLYNAHAAVDVDEKLFRTIRLSDEETHDFTVDTLELLSKDKVGENRLNLLWKAYFVDCQVKSCLDELFQNQSESLVRLIKRKTDGLTSGDIRKSLERADTQVDFPIVTPQPTILASREEVNKPTVRKKRISLKDIIDAGIIKPPLSLEQDYLGKHFTAMVNKDGDVVYDGKEYSSPSAAGGMAKVAVKGPPPTGKPYYSTNGWTFWKYKDPETGNLEELSHLYNIYLEKHSGKVITHKDEGIAYCLTPVKSTKDETNVENVRCLVVENGIYAFSQATPQKNLKPGDRICFYASKVGIIAHARVKTSPKRQPNPIVRDIKKYPFTFEVDEVKYYPDNPVKLDVNLRKRLDAFKGSDIEKLEKHWGWFVTPTRRVTEHDFKMLTR